METTLTHQPFPSAEAAVSDLIQTATRRQRRAPFGVYAIDNSNPGLQSLALEVETGIFSSEFGVSREDLIKEYWGYNETSIWLLAIDHRRAKVAGIIRLIKPSSLGLASVTDMTKAPWTVPLDQVMAASTLPADLAATWDIATLGIYRAYRRQALAGSIVSFALYRGIFRLVAKHHIRYLVAIMVDPLLKRLQQLGRPFDYYDGIGSAVHVGAPSTPIYMDIAAYRRRLRRRQPGLYALIMRGWGWFGRVAYIDAGAR